MLYKLTLPLILASASPVRHKMLLEMGIAHQVIVSTVDEEQEKKGEAIMNFFEMVSLIMRKLSIEEIIAYVDLAQPWNCCGGYRYEALGKHLFAHIKGDPDSVLGLPLLQILTYLHQKKILRI